MNGAEGGSRTHTTLRSTDFRSREGGVHTENLIRRLNSYT